MKLFFAAISLLISTFAFANDCFNANFISAWNYNQAKEAIELHSFSDTYSLKTDLFCHELPWAHRIGFKSFGGGSFICSGDEVVVIDAWNNLVETCRITSIKKNN